jgi:GTP-binding protein
MFVDHALISVQAGDGGHGMIAFRREKFIPYGGPAGGDGGKGGDIWVEADPSLITLRDFRYRRNYRSDRGEHGSGDRRFGRSGDDLALRVPVGTQVSDADSGELLADLVEAGQRVMVAAGGRGGRGNARFATPTNRAPTRAEDGAPGEQRKLRLELKLLADVGLVGLPNAGKSSFLAQISRANPKIADYPFTTLQPNLGLVELAGSDRMPFVVADIPGLIEGAHAGAGLGHQFLRHIERTRVLLFIVDASSGNDGGPLADLASVKRELELYDPELNRKPALVLLNKVDIPAAREQAARLAAELSATGTPALLVSAATGEGVPDALHRTAALLAGLKPTPAES